MHQASPSVTTVDNHILIDAEFRDFNDLDDRQGAVGTNNNIFWAWFSKTQTPLINDGVAIMRSDSDIRRDVEDELRWDPDIDATDIAINASNSVVTLTGLRSYMQKYQAEVDAKRVAGVVAVANDLEVRLPNIDERPGPEIARDATARIKTELPHSWDKIQVIAHSPHAGRRSRMELPAGTCGRGRAPRAGGQRRDQLDRGQAAGRAAGNSPQDRGGVASRRRN